MSWRGFERFWSFLEQHPNIFYVMLGLTLWAVVKSMLILFTVILYQDTCMSPKKAISRIREAVSLSVSWAPCPCSFKKPIYFALKMHLLTCVWYWASLGILLLGLDCMQDQNFVSSSLLDFLQIQISRYLTFAIENTGQTDSSFSSKVFLLNNCSGLFQTLRDATITGLAPTCWSSWDENQTAYVTNLLHHKTSRG